MRKFKPNYLSLSILTALSISIAYAETTNQPTEQLNEIVVSGDSDGSGNSADKSPPKIAETVKTAKKLEKEQAQDVKDLVRYDTGNYRC